MQKRKWIFLLIFTYFFLSINRIDAQFNLTGPVDYEKLFVENLSRGGKVLNLSGKKIGDEGLANLEGMTSLRYVGVAGAGTTEAGRARLAETLPLGVVLPRHDMELETIEIRY